MPCVIKKSDLYIVPRKIQFYQKKQTKGSLAELDTAPGSDLSSRESLQKMLNDFEHIQHKMAERPKSFKAISVFSVFPSMTRRASI